ncbi:MAG: FtsX-like permease family protein [Chitinophagaceae bacterium]|nr:FtsX-like permease family protein [Chitinophagaceae bacterium]
MQSFFAWRYFRSKKSTNTINIIAWISVVAIGVGAAALIIVLSVFNGFEDMVKSLYADFYADIRIAPATGKRFVADAALRKKIQAVQGVAAITSVVEEKALLRNGDMQSIVTVKGIESSYTKVNAIQQHLVRGQFATGNIDQPGLVIGAGVENAIGLGFEDAALPLTLYVPDKKARTIAQLEGLNSYQTVYAGTFLVQQEFDNKYVFTNIDFLRYMLDMPAEAVSAVEVHCANASVDKVQASLQQALGSAFLVETRFEQNKSLFKIMRSEKWIIYAMLSLILVVAAFNMIGALTMLVLEKQKDIAVLKAMGASANWIQGIYLREGLLLATIGGGAGMLLAAIVCWAQVKFKLIALQGNSFLIDYYPVKMIWEDFLLVGITIVVIALLASWLPSRKASVQNFSLKS